MGIFRRAVMLLAAGKLVPALVRRLLLTASRIIPVPFGFLVDAGCLERPAHAYCMWHAAQLAQRLGYRDICVAEFGVAGGVTLMILARYAKEIEKATGVPIKVYGFDTGGGLPELEGAEDLPYWFRPSQYAMDVERLRRSLENAELIIGNVRGTIQDFFTKANRPPLAAVFNDLDLFSSSRDALRILDADSKNFLPRLFMYLDDVGGGPVEMYGPFNGELAANEMFNREPPVFDAAGMIQSMSRKGNCWDNAPMEGCFGTLKTELAHQACYPTRDAARHDLFAYIKGYYNRQRLHSALGHITPEQAERQAA